MQTMAWHRLRQAMRTWFKLRPALLDAGIPRAERVRRFYQTVGASCLWGCGAWTPSSPLRAELDAAELRWLGWMSGVHKRPCDTWVEFYRRRRGAADRLRAADGPLWTLFHRACHASHALLGHVSRRGVARRRMVELDAVPQWPSGRPSRELATSREKMTETCRKHARGIRRRDMTGSVF